MDFPDLRELVVVGPELGLLVRLRLALIDRRKEDAEWVGDGGEGVDDVADEGRLEGREFLVRFRVVEDALEREEDRNKLRRRRLGRKVSVRSPFQGTPRRPPELTFPY